MLQNVNQYSRTSLFQDHYAFTAAAGQSLETSHQVKYLRMRGLQQEEEQLVVWYFNFNHWHQTTPSPRKHGYRLSVSYTW
jgi:hypothetical protein